MVNIIPRELIRNVHFSHFVKIRGDDGLHLWYRDKAQTN